MHSLRFSSLFSCFVIFFLFIANLEIFSVNAASIFSTSETASFENNIKEKNKATLRAKYNLVKNSDFESPEEGGGLTGWTNGKGDAKHAYSGILSMSIAKGQSAMSDFIEIDQDKPYEFIGYAMATDRQTASVRFHLFDRDKTELSAKSLNNRLVTNTEWTKVNASKIIFTNAKYIRIELISGKFSVSETAAIFWDKIHFGIDFEEIEKLEAAQITSEERKEMKEQLDLIEALNKDTPNLISESDFEQGGKEWITFGGYFVKIPDEETGLQNTMLFFEQNTTTRTWGRRTERSYRLWAENKRLIPIERGTEYFGSVFAKTVSENEITRGFVYLKQYTAQKKLIENKNIHLYPGDQIASSEGRRHGKIIRFDPKTAYVKIAVDYTISRPDTHKLYLDDFLFIPLENKLTDEAKSEKEALVKNKNKETQVSKLKKVEAWRASELAKITDESKKEQYFIQNLGIKGKEITLNHPASEVKLNDINNDSFIDLIGVGNEKIKIYKNNKGNFEQNQEIDVSHFNCYKCSIGNVAIGDMNEDGYADIVFQIKSDVYILLNNKYGEFIDKKIYQTSIRAKSLAIIDFNNDKKNDIAILSFDGRRYSHFAVLLNQGGARFDSYPAEAKMVRDHENVQYALLSDVNQDKYPDLVTITSAAFTGETEFQVRINNKRGSFDLFFYATIFDKSSIIIPGDMDGDDVPDMIINGNGQTKENTYFSLFSNDKYGTFKEIFQKIYENKVYTPFYTADVDNDSDIDALFYTKDKEILFMLNNGGIFEKTISVPIKSKQQGEGFFAADFNNDGLIDFGYILDKNIQLQISSSN